MASARPDFALGFSRARGKVIVHVDGALDAASAPELEDRLVDVIDGQGNRQLVLDLTGTTRVDAAGLAVLVLALRRMNEMGGELALSGLTRGVVETIDASGLHGVFRITPSWEHPAHGDGGTGPGRPAGWG
jgi:anti-anti-sigma factor